ncbi:hypothetical protein M436DRAFT_44024 [Aureobasidium namibiae CBS 147.97]|uniref:Uncharacterized protein n=1 Tax=Aureobasidium namibiae CBS 147.97 TaxID=1043004 RepID=A0A074WMF4_9PEZI
MTITISAALFRILIALPIFVIGFRAVDNLNRPITLTNDLSTILSNQTLTLSLPGHSNVATTYIPISLTDNGRASIFWCGLLALSCPGAYVIGKLQNHIFSQLLALDEGSKTVPKGQKLSFHLQGVRNLDVVGWINATGARDTAMAWVLSLLAMAGITYASVVAGIQNLASDTVLVQLEKFLNSGDAAGETVFGSSDAHGSYTLESWTCQIAPLLLESKDAIHTKARTVLDQACRDGRNSRYLLLTMLPLAISMLLSIAKPHWFTYTFGAKEKPAWMTVPLEDNDSSQEDDDPMAGYGGNARDQWQLDSD